MEKENLKVRIDKSEIRHASRSRAAPGTKISPPWSATRSTINRLVLINGVTIWVGTEPDGNVLAIDLDTGELTELLAP